MRACLGCKDPACGDDDKHILYKGVECLTCKKARPDEVMFINRENWKMSEQDELSKRAEAYIQATFESELPIDCLSDNKDSATRLSAYLKNIYKAGALEERAGILNIMWTLVEADLLRGAEGEHGRGWDAGRKSLLFELKQKLELATAKQGVG